MKNIYILKGWFNMEEIKNGVISEEALEEIAGGLKMPKLTLKGVLAAAGVAVAALGALGGTATIGTVAYKLGKKHVNDFPLYEKGEPKNDPSKSFKITDLK